MTYKEQRKIFKKTLDWVIERIDMGRLNQTSGDLLENASATLRQEVRDYFKKKSGAKFSLISQYLKNDYSHYLDSMDKRHKGIKKATINDFKPKFRKELENRVLNSFNYIKNKDNEIIAQLASRFMSWVTIDSKEVRGDKTDADSLLRFMDFAKENDISKDHLDFIIKDQTRKMITSFDMLLAKDNNAIGAIWNNRGDRRVVGNPEGLYPYGNKAHGDHWEREGKFYIFKDSWAYKNGFVKSKGNLYENLEDGGAGVAIGCRCWLTMIYDLEDVPFEYLTKKAKEVISA